MAEQYVAAHLFGDLRVQITAQVPKHSGVRPFTSCVVNLGEHGEHDSSLRLSASKWTDMHLARDAPAVLLCLALRTAAHVALVCVFEVRQCAEPAQSAGAAALRAALTASSIWRSWPTGERVFEMC